MTEREQNRIASRLEFMARDIRNHLAWIEDALTRMGARALARSSAGVPKRSSADASERAVNTQNNNNCPTVNNKQTKTCVCVSRTDDKTENTHTQVLSLDFVQSNLPEGIPDWYAAYWYKLMQRRNWSLKDGKQVTAANWQYFLGTFFEHATDEELAAAHNARQEQEVPLESPEAIRKRLLAEQEVLFGKQSDI